MKRTTAWVILGPPEPGVHEIDAIEIDGRLRLVPEWEEVPGAGSMRPVRLVGERLGHPRRALQFEVPMSVLLGESPPAEDSGLEVIEGPHIEFPGSVVDQ